MRKRILCICGIATLMIAARSDNACAADKEQDEQKMAFKDVPKAVRKTLKREAGDVKIKKVDKEKLKGKTVFEADVKIDDHNYEIVVSEDGLLISKTLDDEESESKDESKKGARSKQEDKEDHEDNKK